MTTQDIKNLCVYCNTPYVEGTAYCGNCGRSVVGGNTRTTLQGTDQSNFQFPLSTPGSSDYLTPPTGFMVPVAPAKPSEISRKVIIFSAIILLLLLFVGAGLFEFAYQLGRNSVLTGAASQGTRGVSGTSVANVNASNTAAAATQTAGAGLTQTAEATATSPSSSPTAQPTLVAPSGTVVYQENGSDGWQGWALSSDWRKVANNKLLSDDGSAGSNQAGPSAIPPYTIPAGVQNFAIVANVTMPQPLNNAHFSLTACGRTTSNGWQGYEGLENGGQAFIFANSNTLAQTNFNPGTGPHTYRLEVRGNVITLYIDNALVVQATDNTFLPCGSQVGMVSSQAIVHVSSFQVIKL